jgi:hypothetical protein
MKAKKYQMGGPIDPDPKKKAKVGGVAQRTKAEEKAFEERRIEGMRESLLEGEGMKALQEYDKELAAKGYSFPNGSSIKGKMMGGGKMPMYMYGGKMKKYIKGGQMKLDANNDGKISAVDFAMLRKMKK